MQSRRWTISAVVGALGIVYGDIGTSPLYAFDATLTVAGRFDSELVLGALSLIPAAVTVLSAVEGLEVLNPSLKSTVVPITVGVIIGLFAYQHRGTARIGSLFGPIMVVWFVVIGLSGAAAIRRDPVVLAAVNPLYGLELL